MPDAHLRRTMGSPTFTGCAIFGRPRGSSTGEPRWVPRGRSGLPVGPLDFRLVLAARPTGLPAIGRNCSRSILPDRASRFVLCCRTCLRFFELYIFVYDIRSSLKHHSRRRLISTTLPLQTRVKFLRETWVAAVLPFLQQF